MQRQKGTGLLVFLLAIAAVFSSGCEKERKTRFVQGDGEYVYTINEFNSQKYTLKTGKKLTRGVTTKADQVVVNDNTSVIRAYDAVEFQLETDFGDFDNASMSNFQFFGKEDQEYEVRVQFTEDNLVFFKVAEEKLIPSNEMTYAEKVEANLYRVPIFGLPLGKFTIERVKDDRGKSSNQMKTYAEKFLKDSTHFTVKAKNPAYFDSKLKLDMFPASFFDSSNEWFFEVTVVDRPAVSSTAPELGMQLSSGKAKFYKTNKTLTVVNLNTPEELKDQDPEKQTTLLELPAKWMDFRLLTTGDKAYLKEELFDDIAAGAKYWNEREFVQLGLDKVISAEIGTDSLVAGTLRIKRLEVADDYFSFIVFDSLTKVSLHYSFAKENRQVAGQNYPTEDWRKHGFFYTLKSALSDPLYTSEEYQIKDRFVQRMYPKDGIVHFHITENTPRDAVFIEAIEEAAKAWNGAFAEAAKGTAHEANPIRVVFDKDQPVQNGDARYHKVSFYGYEVDSGLLGYGPSVADDRNGETYSSTNHIYLRNYRQQILRNVVKYVRYRLGVYNALDVEGITLPNQILATSSDVDYVYAPFVSGSSAPVARGGALSMAALPDEEMAALVSPLDTFEALTPAGAADAQKAAQARMEASHKNQFKARERGKLYKDFVSARNRLAMGIDDEAAFGKSVAKAIAAEKEFGSCDHLAGTALSFKEIEEVCMTDGNRFKDYVEDLLEKNASTGLDYRLDDEKSVFYDCAQKLMKPTLISTLVHEFGHNFGLTHNFAGSSDAANFARDKDGVPEVRSTSVMDYAHYDADRGFKPGPYDVATIRYGYYNAVEAVDANGNKSIVDITRKPGTTTSINDRLKEQNLNAKAREFNYCWDRDIATGEVPVENPNCRRRDQGSDPVQQVRSFIDDFNTLMLTSANRFDNVGAATSNSVGNSVANSYLVPIKLIYDKYRFLLNEKAFAKGYNDPYFDIFSSKLVEEKTLGADVVAKVFALKAEILELAKDKAKAPRHTLTIENKVLALPELAQYKLATEFIKDFYHQIIFSEDLYCVVTGNQGQELAAADIQAFAALRKQIYNANGSDILRCEDPAVLAYYNGLASSGALAGFSSVSKVVSVGNPANDILYSADIQKNPIRGAVRAGLNGLRSKAVGVLSSRSNTTGTGVTLIQSKGFFPALLDEETFRKKILDDLRTRYVEGVNGSKILAKASEKAGQPIAVGAMSRLVDGQGKLNLPQFEEESALIQSLLVGYRAGAISPLSVTNERIADIQVSTSSETSFQTFLRSAPDAALYDYFIAGSNAYYSKGATAATILGSIRDTLNNVSLADNMALAVGPSGELTDKSMNQIRSRLVQFAKDFRTEENAGDTTAKSVLYKVRACVKDKLVARFQTKLDGFKLESDPDFAYIQANCRNNAVAESELIAKYFGDAEKIVDFIAARDEKALAIALVESVLTQVGLPTAPDQKKTTATIVSGSLAAQLGDAVGRASLYESTIFSALATAMVDTKNNPAGKDKLYSLTQNANALDAEIKAVSGARVKALTPYSRYRDLFKKKVDILQTAIFNSAK